MLDFRKDEDKAAGAGYKVFCDSCGQTSLSSHGRYCPVCGRDSITPITVTKLGEEKKATVTFRITGYFKAEVPYTDGDTFADVTKRGEEAYDSADFGPLHNIEAELVSIEK
jgi:hypothetical protein